MFFSRLFKRKGQALPPTHGTIKDCSYTQVDDDVAADLIGKSILGVIIDPALQFSRLPGYKLPDPEFETQQSLLNNPL